MWSRLTRRRRRPPPRPGEMPPSAATGPGSSCPGSGAGIGPRGNPGTNRSGRPCLPAPGARSGKSGQHENVSIPLESRAKRHNSRHWSGASLHLRDWARKPPSAVFAREGVRASFLRNPAITDARTTRTAPEQYRSGRTAQSRPPSAARLTLAAETRGTKRQFPRKCHQSRETALAYSDLMRNVPEFEDQGTLTAAPRPSRRGRTPPAHSDFAPLVVPRISPQRSSSTCANRGIRTPKEGKSW